MHSIAAVTRFCLDYRALRKIPQLLKSIASDPAVFVSAEIFKRPRSLGVDLVVFVSAPPRTKWPGDEGRHRRDR